MASRVRISKLSRRLGVTPDVVLRTLRGLGETRYRSDADILPDDVANRVEEALQLAGVARPAPAPTVRHIVVPPPEEPAPEPAPEPEPEPEPAPESRGDARRARRAPRPEKRAAVEEIGPDDAAIAGPGATLSVKAFASLLADPAAKHTAGPAKVEPAPERGAADSELKRLRDDVARLERELGEQQSRAATAEDAWRKHAEQRKAAVAELEAVRAELEAVHADLKSQRRARERDKADHDRTVVDLKTEAEAARTEPLRALLDDRGVQSPEELRQVLACLLDEDRAGLTTRSLRVAGPDRFARVLKQRLLLWCGDDACVTDHPEDGRIVVAHPGRCEVCKGSTIHRAALSFVEVCRRAGFKRVTIAGGSPAYRTAIQDAIGGAFDVRVVLDGERNAAQAQADVDGSDLVVVWLATEVSHRFTGLYTAIRDGDQDGKVLRCDIRGISRMFQLATAHVTGRSAASRPSG